MNSAVVTTYAILKTAEISVRALAAATFGRLSPEYVDRMLGQWSRGMVELARVQLIVDGLEHLPADRAVVLMSNHQSHFDIPILYCAFPRRLRMVAKAELFRVPIWGRAMRESGFVRVDRSGDRAQAEAAMREAGEAIARGVNVWLAPEGTRSVDGTLGKFKKGGFLLARATGAPIVPVAIDGTRDILPKNTRRIHLGVPVRVTFGAPIEVAGRSVEELMTAVRSFVENHVTQNTES